MEYPFGQFGSAVLTVSPPKILPAPSPLAVGVVRGDSVGETTLMPCQLCPAVAKTLIISTFVATYTEYSTVRTVKGKINFLSARPNTSFYVTEWLMWEETGGGHLIQPPALAGSPWAVTQDCVQMAFEYLWGRRLHSLSVQPVPVLCHPHSKEFLPHVQAELCVFQFFVLPLITHM